MEKKNSQENAIDTIETIETTIDINSLSTESLETKGDINQHREKIRKIVVPQYKEDNYAVTYSKKDNSILVWTINIEENGQQQPDVYFELDQSYNIAIESFVLYKKILLFLYYERDFRKYLIRY